MKNNLKIKTAFTLAEVLIVLAVIGVIAVLTIPTLLQSTNEQELKTAFKKQYSVLSQATARLVADSGGTLKGDAKYIDRYAKYLNATKICQPEEAFGNCWHKLGEFKFLNGISVTGYSEESGMILSNGTLLFIDWRSSDCSQVPFGIPVCAVMHVDVNGFKGPNMIGKDIYKMYLFETTIKPVGIPEDNVNPNADCSSAGRGYSCSYKVLTE